MIRHSDMFQHMVTANAYEPTSHYLTMCLRLGVILRAKLLLIRWLPMWLRPRIHRPSGKAQDRHRQCGSQVNSRYTNSE